MAQPRSIRGVRIGSDPRNGLPAVRPYVYRGTKHDTGDDVAKIAQRAEQGRRAALSRWQPGDPIDHGTQRGYQQERRLKLPHCRPCKDAHNAASVAYHAASKKRGEAA